MTAPSEDELVELATRLGAYFARRAGAADVEDLVHETLVRLLESLESSWIPGAGRSRSSPSASWRGTSCGITGA